MESWSLVISGLNANNDRTSKLLMTNSGMTTNPVPIKKPHPILGELDLRFRLNMKAGRPKVETVDRSSGQIEWTEDASQRNHPIGTILLFFLGFRLALSLFPFGVFREFAPTWPRDADQQQAQD